MADDEKKNKKDNDPQKLVITGDLSTLGSIVGSNKDNIQITKIGGEGILGSDYARIASGAGIIKTNPDLAREAYKAGATFINPSVDVGTYKSITLGTERAGASHVQPSGFLGAFSVPPTTVGLDRQFTALRIDANPNEGNLTREDIEKLIDKKLPAKKEDGLKEEKVVEIVNKVIKNKNKQEEENILVINKKALEFITKELLDKKIMAWHCAICKGKLDTFEGEEGIKKFNDYLVKFRNGILKKCPNHGHHENWFEVRENGFIYLAKNPYEKVFKKKED